ncbi:MAG: hypothetical protein UR61_C0063G0002 [candidate division WS6 bacterium GW2011_GWE1_34_7]|uniref:Uncharacterized protein n=1 Tax=candidate division WS6 bacterium GW2011_GWE1_34_7 TaxID=1619093 RepID=A0A0G0B354_9BACT|nr:MAG: hypothetical protein UR61_C0063G0002 [candidate division WS6 bacterium GW2011_GWE1_34_7]KKQ76251.1 MAG: hypothetical protein US97_C0015G0008 [Microgenomates group bacterium GW2011_GWF1_38_5]
MSDMQGIKDLLITKQVPIPNTVNSSTVNGSSKNCLDTSTVNSMDTSDIDVKTRHSKDTSTVYKKLDSLLKEIPLEVDFVAGKLASELDDMKSIGLYKILAREYESALLFEYLSCTNKAFKDGKVWTSKAIYFLGILKKKGLRVRFRDNNAV